MSMADPGVLLQLGGLFLAAFGAATILPFQSEVVFVGLQLAGTASVLWLIVVASVGNTLGAVVNYVMGPRPRAVSHIAAGFRSIQRNWRAHSAGMPAGGSGPC